MPRFLTTLFLRSPIGRYGDRLWEANETDAHMQLSKLQKLVVTLYLVVRDSEAGKFPPRPADTIEEAHAREREYLDRLAGVSRKEMDRLGLQKPFWGGRDMQRLLQDFCRTDRIFRSAGLEPPARLLELGCGSGWFAELFARCGYDVLGTTLDPQTVSLAQRRARAFDTLGKDGSLSYTTAAMEELSTTLQGEKPFDAAFMYEALHHVHDWRQSLTECAKVLRPGGKLLIANEPNLIHTIKSYRVAQLTGTHEIGMSRPALIEHLLANGFSDVRIVRHRLACGLLPIWLLATRADDAPQSSSTVSSR